MESPELCRFIDFMAKMIEKYRAELERKENQKEALESDADRKYKNPSLILEKEVDIGYNIVGTDNSISIKNDRGKI